MGNDLDDAFTQGLNELGEAVEPKRPQRAKDHRLKRKKKRQERKAKRKANRGKYSGQ